MGIITKKDVSLGQVFSNVYLKIDNIRWRAVPPAWEVDISTWINKTSRDILIIKEFINGRMEQKKPEPFEYNEAWANELGLTPEQWDAVTISGPWTDFSELREVHQNFLSVATNPIDTFTYTTEEITSFPESLSNIGAVKEWFYQHLMAGELQKILLANTTQITQEELEESIQKDDEDFTAVVQRYITNYPVLGKQFPGETKLVTIRQSGEIVKIPLPTTA